MDPNSTNYGGSSTGARDSALGAGTDSLGVTGAGAGQSSSGGLTPSSAGSQGMGGSYGSSSAGLGGQGLGEQPMTGGAGGQNLGERLGDAKDAAADKLSQARDVAGDKLSQARDAAGDRLGQAKEKATELKATLADKLEQGAQSLRNQGGSQQFAGANGATVDSGMNKYAAPAAVAMERTAEFLRGEGDLRGAVEEQVRTNPGRTLLIALGVGYMLGKALRR